MIRKFILGILFTLLSIFLGIRWIYFDASILKISKVNFIIIVISTFIILLISFFIRKIKRATSQILGLLGLEIGLFLSYSYYQPLCEPCLVCEDCMPCLSNAQKIIFWIGLFILIAFIIWKFAQKKHFSNNGL